MNNYIQNLTKTQGWKEIEKMMETEIRACKTETVDENLNASTYKQNSLANLKASKRIASLLNRIRLAGGVLNKETKSYK